VKTAALTVLACSALLAVPRASAISKAKSASPLPGATPAGEAPAAPPEPPLLAKIVGRLAGTAAPGARDWAELGRETVSWGGKLQSEQQPVPEGPVRDALTAVDLGAKLDPKATDWPKLREDLQALLKKSDEQQNQDQQQNDQNKDQNQDQEQQNKDKQDKKDQKDQQQKQDQSKSEEKKDDQKGSDEKPSGESKDQEQKPNDSGESAFGDMKDKTEPPPPPPESTQKVGGAPEKKEGEPKEQIDPSLALPMQKLEQLRAQDSPAQLFQLMEGEKKAAKKPSKDW
jgi:Ca-activated chloride channel family protein